MSCFITGTDTGVGKTTVTLALMQLLQARGRSVCGYKPVAAGSELVAGREVNADALALQQQGSVSLPYAAINPVLLAPPIAPHIAAQEAGVAIHIPELVAQYHALAARVDQVLVEGAGGWRVPINATETLADLARTLKLPVVLVVGLRLGCLNHALLTAQAIRADGLLLAGWVANTLDPAMARQDENLRSLAARLEAPLLGRVPWLGSHPASRQVADCLAQTLPMDLSWLA